MFATPVKVQKHRPFTNDQLPRSQSVQVVRAERCLGRGLHPKHLIQSIAEAGQFVGRDEDGRSIETVAFKRGIDDAIGLLLEHDCQDSAAEVLDDQLAWLEVVKSALFKCGKDLHSPPHGLWNQPPPGLPR